MKMNRGLSYAWVRPEVDDAAVRDLAARCNLVMPLAQLLYGRGMTTAEEVHRFIAMGPEWIADPTRLKGAEAAAARIVHAVKNNQKILIFGDYDVDGITSTAIMLSCLVPLGASINYFLPNRVRDGYGLSTKIVDKAADNGYQLIVTVDNGITAYDAAALARKRGVDVVITDHHQVHGALPDADIIVNPHQPDCEYPYKDFAGVGVIFKIMTLVCKALGVTMPPKAYELLMLGTVADVVPLREENRYWVQHGLGLVNRDRSFAMQVLAANGRVEKKERLSSRDIGFAIAPQLNALGRLDDPRDGVRFLISNEWADVMQIGVTLKAINEERKRVDRGIYDQVVRRIEAGAINLETERLILATDDNWPTGVIGLVAGKLMQTYGRPAILLHTTKNGVAKGSCRSIPAFNMFDALASCEDILTTFGGHACAAGLSLPIDKVDELKARMEARLAEQLTEEDLVQKITIDAEMSLADAHRSFMQQMHMLEPFGNSNPEPLFKFPGVVLASPPTLLKEKHLKCMLFADGVVKPVMFFNKAEWYQPLMERGNEPFSVAAHVVENEWQGTKNIELSGVDIAWE
jgi:single-stranded-DNA-specific exonuclease